MTPKEQRTVPTLGRSQLRQKRTVPSVPPSYEAELAVAITAARQAAAIQRELFGHLEHVTAKGKRDVVTEADYRSEAAIMAAITDAFPDDAIVTEESGAHGVALEQAIDGPAGPAAVARAWFVDPLDGTVNFANGIPFFCAAVGFAYEGRPVVGVIYDASRDELFQAVAGRGATRDGDPFRVTRGRTLEESLLGLVHHRGFLRSVARLRPLVRAVRDLGSAALSVAYVGGSRLDAYIQPRGLAPWDLCAAGLIAEEGGATVTAFDGGPWFRYPDRLVRRAPDGASRPPSLGVLAAGPSIHAQLQTVLTLGRS
jgi:myo-inositol-1(or 4)-monophosphatase